MNTLVFFMTGYTFFLLALFSYMYRLDQKQKKIKTMIDDLKNQQNS